VPNLLDVRGVRRRFGGLVALDSVDLQIEAGARHGLIGPNGSGKSTLLKTIAGQYYPNAGQVLLDGRDIARLAPAARVRAGLAIKFQIASVFDHLSVFDNVLVSLQRESGWAGLIASRSRRRLCAEAERHLERFGLMRRAEEPAGVLSHGEKQWLEIAMAIASEPRLLLLDEPTAGMSPEERGATGEILRTLDCAMLVVEHDIDFVKSLCSTITVLDRGKVVANGPPEAIESDGRVRSIYLATTAEVG